MRITYITIFVLALTANAFATRQLPDRIVYEGKEYITNSRGCPHPQLYMEEYFKKHPEKRPPKEGRPSTALYRGYVARYEIKDSLLILNDILVRSRDDPNLWQSVEISFVPDGSNLVVDWYTGVVVLHPKDEWIDGKRRNSLSLNQGDIETILLQIEKGKLTRVCKFGVGEYDEFKVKQFETFRETEAYDKAVEERLKLGNDPAHVDVIINNFVMYYSGRILVDH